MTFDDVRPIADAILLEGYALYPYRASSRKNRYRWTFGVLAPRAWSEAGGCEPWWMEAQCLVRDAGRATLTPQLRFLQVERRRVREVDGAVLRDVDRLDVDGRLFVSWDEGDLRELDVERVALADISASDLVVPLRMLESSSVEDLHGLDGARRGQVVRSGLPIRGSIRFRCEPSEVAGVVRLSVRVENVTPWSDLAATRETILAASCVATHLLLAIEGGEFFSLLDPPEAARGAATTCKNVGTYPVLIGPAGARDRVLSAPIILYDHPRLAPESPGDFFDATEIDELLSLRTSTLTDGEKREARATDARAAALVDRTEALPPELLERLHGAVRDLDQAEMRPRQASADQRSEKAGPAVGSRVRLRPGRRRTDAQDLLFVGCIATVERVMVDVDGQEFLAVVLDDDPASDLHRWQGRFHYYYPDEVEMVPLEGQPA
jgi:hypothetical protein